MKAVIEKFKPINGYEDYQVSDYGTVRSLKFSKVKYLKNKKDRDGYCQICLCRDGKRKWFMIHRLVWEAFVGEIPEGYEIDHVNAIRDDNRLDNLRVVTSKENSNNPITLVRNRETTRKSHNKPVLQLDKTTSEVIREWECASDAWRELGINYQNISKCCHGKLKSAGGYRWQFTSD